MGSVRKAVEFTWLVLGCTAGAYVSLLYARVLFTAYAELTELREGGPVRVSIFEAGIFSTLFMLLFLAAYLMLKMLMHSLNEYQSRSWTGVEAILKLIKIIFSGVTVIGSLFLYYVLVYAMAGATFEEEVKNKANIQKKVFESAIFSTFLTSLFYISHKNIVASLRALRDPEFISMMAYSNRFTAEVLAAVNQLYLSMFSVFFLFFTTLHSSITFSSENLCRIMRSKLEPGLIEAAVASSLLTVLFFMGYIRHKYRIHEPRQAEHTPLWLIRERLRRRVRFYEDEMSNRTAPANNGENCENRGVCVIKFTVNEVWSPNYPTNPKDISIPPKDQDETNDQNSEGNTLADEDGVLLPHCGGVKP